MNICVIPARGGSKRIPRKNIKLFCGKSMIRYSIEAAIESSLFDKLVVSTDNEEIAFYRKDPSFFHHCSAAYFKMIPSPASATELLLPKETPMR